MNFMDIFHFQSIGLILTLVLLSIYLYGKWKHSYWKSRGVPGPKPFPMLGIMKSYFQKGMHKTDLELREKYGKVVGVYHGHVPMLLVFDPEMLKEIFIKQHKNFSDRAFPTKTNKAKQSSPILAGGENWKFLRNTLSSAYTSSKLRSMTKSIQRCCEDLLENLETHGDNNGQLDVRQVFEAYSMDVIATTGFGIEINSQKNPENKFNYFGRKAAIGSLPKMSLMLMLIFPFLKNFMSIRSNSPDASAFFQSVTTSAVKMRKGDEQVHHDVLQLMINAMNEEKSSTEGGYQKRRLNQLELFISSLALLLAGFDTTSNTISFATYVLATHPDIQKRLTEEINNVLKGDKPSFDGLSKLAYLDMFTQEVLRLFGAALRSLDRECVQDTVVNGMHIEKGTILSIPFYAIHRDPEFWPDPEKFDPERFTPENIAKRPEYSYIPFGIGPRICLGRRLAVLELKLAIVNLLQNFQFSPSENTKNALDFEHSSILRAKNGVWLKIELRKKVEE